MLTNYHTLRALVREWEPRLKGSTLSDAFSQSRGECTLVFEKATEPNSTESLSSLRISVQSPLIYLFLNPGISRARKNVAGLFEESRGAQVDTISIALGDRLIDIMMTDGAFIRIVPYGPRANIYLVGRDGVVEDRFRSRGAEK